MNAFGLGFGEHFCLTLLTDRPRLAAEADEAGVDRIGVDLERLGKAERQAGYETRLSTHDWTDLARVGGAIARAELFVRLNPLHASTASEVDRAIDLGAEVLMLPYFNGAEEVGAFVGLVRRRARVVVLVETAPAITRIRDIVAVPGVDEVMFGLNDLRLQLGVANHFEVLASPLLDAAAAEVRRCGLRLAMGGVGRVDGPPLPVPADLVCAQYPRLGATGAWIARSFLESSPGAASFGDSIRALRQRLSEWAMATPAALEKAREDLALAARRWKQDTINRRADRIDMP